MAGQADPIDRGRETLLRALREGNVRFVVIGGAALLVTALNTRYAIIKGILPRNE